MDDKIKLIVVAVGGLVVPFVLFILVFYVLKGEKSSPTAAELAQQQAPSGPVAGVASPDTGSMSIRKSRELGSELVTSTDALVGDIPTDPKIQGYGWAKWGMSPQEVVDSLKRDGVSQPEVYKSPDNPAFTSVVALNPDAKRFKIEYRFDSEKLFHIEIYFSDFYKQNTLYNEFLSAMMNDYGYPYEQYATVDELGNVMLHATWYTLDSVIEMVSRPKGYYSLFLDHQETILNLGRTRIRDEKQRKFY